MKTLISSSQIKRQQSHVKKEVIRQDYLPLSQVQTFDNRPKKPEFKTRDIEEETNKMISAVNSSRLLPQYKVMDAVTLDKNKQSLEKRSQSHQRGLGLQSWKQKK